MKKKNVYISLLLLGCVSTLLFSSCKKYLTVENPSTISQNAVFNSLSYAKSAVVGVYNQLIGDNGYGIRLSLYYPLSSDAFKTSGDYSANDRRGISMYGAAPTNPEMDKPFRQLYTGIERANICIKYIPESDLYKNGDEEDKAEMKKLYGEVLTLRAQFYYELVRNWGDVPAQWIPSADMENLYIPQTSRDSIYDHLLRDLKLAETLVPWRSESSTPNPSRISKGVVKGLRARIALANGGYSLRGNKMARRDDWEKFYQIADDECKDLMDHRNENDLNTNYENLFRALHNGNYDQLDPAHELMWVVGAYGGNSKTDSKLGYYNGLRSDINSVYGRGGGGIDAVPTYFYEFDSIGDSRRDVDLVIYEIDKNSQEMLSPGRSWKDGKFRKPWTDVRGPSQNLGIDWPLLRFSDVLLMYAEAENELNSGPTAGASEALMEVRKRAFKGYESRVSSPPSSKEGFFKALVHERLLEFGGEGIRKYDLIRWNLLDDKIKETRKKLRAFMNGTGRYANVPEYIYAKPADYNPSWSARECIENLDLYGGDPARVLYYPTPGTAPDPDDNYKKIEWRASETEELIESPRKGFCQYFEKGKSELFPFYFGILNQNYKLEQNNGY